MRGGVLGAAGAGLVRLPSVGDAPVKTKNIEKWRREIDGLDRELKRLLLKRFKLSRRVIEAKRALGLPKQDLRREREILARLAKNLAPAEAKLIQGVYREIFRQAVRNGPRNAPPRAVREIRPSTR